MKNYTHSIGYKSFITFNYLLLTILSLITVIPILYVFSMSIRPEIDIIKFGQTLIPKNISFAAYTEIFAGNKITDAFKTTIFITVVGTVIALFMNAITAYPLSKSHLPYNRVFSFMIYFTVLFSGGLVPYFLVIKAIGLNNSIWAIILGGAIWPFNVILFRNFFSVIPPELEESAKIDGASDYTVFFRIILPLSLPVMATMTLFISVGFWNEWFSALIFLNDTKKWPLQLLLREILSTGLTSQIQQASASSQAIRPSETLKMAVVVVATIPIMCVYPFLQKYFMKGLTMGAVKG